jgi:hypothetical protein
MTGPTRALRIIRDKRLGRLSTTSPGYNKPALDALPQQEATISRRRR